MDDTFLGLIDKRVELMVEKLEELALQYGPDVITAALTVIQINAINILITASLMLLSSLIIGFLSYRLIRFLYKKDESEIGPLIFLGLVGSILTGGLFIGGGIRALDMWTWVALFEPKLAVAKRILDGVL